jgi:hypothetical protein
MGHLAKNLKSVFPEVLGVSDDALELRVVHYPCNSLSRL